IDPNDPTVADDPTKTREIGVSIAVTPTILPDDTIRMALRPRSAQVTEYIAGRSGNIFPRVNESSVDTIARIPNGNSLLIGGFYEEIEGDEQTKVPILGDIPVLKFFFSSSEKTKSHTSLIFVVTPKLYDPVSKSQTLTTTRDLQQRHAVPHDHSWPDRHNPGFGYEPNLGWAAGNMVNAYEPTPPSNPLHPEHPVNQPEDALFGPQERQTFAPELDPQPRPKRRGLLNRLFNRDNP
ncbi:MAG: type II and III secretion system protein, partial [Rhodothermales bacterium]|nr:type II and III secretion system protein [Rhodothermales bacterium]